LSATSALVEMRTAPPPPPSAWYLVQCKLHQDRRAIDNLRNQGFAAFAPYCVAERRVRQRVVPRREPLFPGYAFVELNRTEHNWGALRSTRGVARLVRFGSHAAAVPSSVIEHLRSVDGVALRSRLAAFNYGEKVRIVEGPFAELEAVFEEADGEARVRVLIEIMHREVSIQLRAAAIVRA
jgi:transcriptional antiterminator RfaH